MNNLSMGIKCVIFVIILLLQNNKLINKFRVNLTQSIGVPSTFTLLATHELLYERLEVLEYYRYLSSFLLLEYVSNSYLVLIPFCK